MKILIAGAQGQVGSELVVQTKAKGHEVFAFGSKQLNIADAQQVMQIAEKMKPDVIINAAAYTAVDKAESEQELAYAVNATGAENLALACKQLDIPLLHISTDYVFDGDKGSSYNEEDPATPIGVYGASKLQGDEKIIEIWPKHIILRVSWVFAQQGNNFVHTMLRLAEQRDELSIVDDQYGAPTSAVAISQCLLAIMNHSSFNQSNCPWGSYHLQSEPGVTWYQFAQEIFAQAKHLGLINKEMRLKPIPSSDYPTPVTRPANSKLDGSKLLHTFGITPAIWQADLHEILTQL